MSEKPPSKPIRVVDRRWFTPDGELRELPEEPAAGPPASAAVPGSAEPPSTTEAPAGASAKSSENLAGVRSGLTLLDLIDALAQPAVALLSGQVPGRGRDLEGARYYIDLLGVLRERLDNSLRAEEVRYLDDVLYQLRSLFVAATR